MKKTIKNLTAAMIFGGALMGSSSLFAAPVPHDLYMGFQNQTSKGTADYIIDLGLDTSIVGGNTVVNLSSAFNFGDFTSTGLEGTNAATIQGGVVGGLGSGSPAGVYVTQQRLGGAGAPSVPGSSQPANQTKSEDVEAWTDGMNNIVAPAIGTGLLDTTLSWENHIEPTFTASSLYGIIGVDPDSSVTTNSVLYEDLWFTQSSGSQQAYVYEGYFTLTVTTSSASLTFTPANATAPLTSPQIQSIQVANNAATVIWSTVPTHTYQLQYNLDLNTSNWVNVGSSQPASTSTLTNTDNSATQQMKFYRVTGQ